VKVRRVAAITITGAVLMAVVAGLGLFVVNASREASEIGGRLIYYNANPWLLFVVFSGVSTLAAIWLYLLAFLKEDSG
jgi:hypothetical protein